LHAPAGPAWPRVNQCPYAGEWGAHHVYRGTCGDSAISSIGSRHCRVMGMGQLCCGGACVLQCERHFWGQTCILLFCLLAVQIPRTLSSLLAPPGHQSRFGYWITASLAPDEPISPKPLNPETLIEVMILPRSFPSVLSHAPTLITPFSTLLQLWLFWRLSLRVSNSYL
jgi:hypothetical protein